MRTLKGATITGLAALSLAACAGTPSIELATAPPTPEVLEPAPVLAPPRPAATARARPFPRGARRGKGGGRYTVGAPYRVAGRLYVPADQPSYDEVGVASWYGEAFDGRATANGERFDMYSASAAHTTLPLPSIVEVTNLENGRSIRVRLNDRGPFKAGRIIDLSKAAARRLGYVEKGLARVRVRYIGPARLDGSLTPLYVANADAGTTLAAASARPVPAAARTVWRAEPSAARTLAFRTAEADLPPLW
jgi:rare lipoprotein A (peptidoglycan hydrolase)